MKRDRLVKIVKQIAAENQSWLAEKKEEAVRGLDKPDFLWYYLLQSMATMLSQTGWEGLFKRSDLYDRVTYEALERQSPEERLATLKTTFRAAKFRMPDQRAEWMNSNFERIRQLGGPKAAKQRFLSLEGSEAKRSFLNEFAGVSDKYSRNIGMDVYHPDFRQYIALDSRIDKVSHVMGIASQNYQKRERFYQDVAHEAGLEPWELDRILYNFMDRILAELAGGSKNNDAGS